MKRKEARGNKRTIKTRGKSTVKSTKSIVNKLNKKPIKRSVKKSSDQGLMSKKMLALIIFTMVLFGTLGIWAMVTSDNLVEAAVSNNANTVIKFTIEKPLNDSSKNMVVDNEKEKDF